MQSIIVPAVGPTDAPIAIIGEAPGKDEERERIPFTGRAGGLFNQLLSVAQIPRSITYIDNVFQTRPADSKKKSNDITAWVDLSKKEPLLTDYYKEARESLFDRLKQIDAKVIVAMGGIPLFTLMDLHPHKITKRRGSIYLSPRLPGKKIVACIHPAACLYNTKGQYGGKYIWRYFITYDLTRAKYESEHPELPLPEHNIIINPSFDQVMNFIWTCKGKKIIAFDIECTRINPEVTHISFSYNGGEKSISIPFSNSSGYEYFPINQEKDIWNSIASLLEDDKVVKIGQGIMFDRQFLFRKYGIVIRNTQDTMIQSAIISPDFPKGLDWIASVYTRIPYYKDEGKMHKHAKRDPDSFQIYNAKDSIVCDEVFSKLKWEVDHMGNEDTYRIQNRVCNPLLYMQERGIKFDVEAVKIERISVAKDIRELKDKFSRMAGREISTTSDKQMMQYFYVEKNLTPYVKRGTGAWTLDVTALKRLQNKGIPEASILLRIRKLSTYHDRYLTTIADPDGRIRSSFNPVGAADSGRLSSSKTIWETGGNIQNTTEEFRKFMLFDEGYVGYDIDLAQAENRLVAFIAPEPLMWKQFEDGDDVHSATGAAIANIILGRNDITPEMVKQWYNEGTTCDLGDGTKSWRFWGKQANHAFNYGFGYVSFALKYECDQISAKKIYLAYHRLYPNIKNSYWEWVVEALRADRRILTNCYGRKRKFMERWGDGLFKEAYSYVPQSTVATKINEEGLNYVHYNQDKFAPVELLNQVHDSLVFQIPLTIGWRRHAEIILDLKRNLETPIRWKGREMVIPVDCKVGRNMKDMKEVGTSDSIEGVANNLKEVWSERGNGN